MYKRILFIIFVIVIISTIILSLFLIFNLNKKTEQVNQASDIPIVDPKKPISFSNTGAIDIKDSGLTYVVGKLKSTSEKFGAIYGTFEISTGDKKNQNFLLFSANSLLSIEIYKTDNINEIKDEKREYVNIEDSSKAHEYLKKNIDNNFLLKIISSESDADEKIISYLDCNKELTTQLISNKFNGVNCTPYIWTISKHENGK